MLLFSTYDGMNGTIFPVLGHFQLMYNLDTHPRNECSFFRVRFPFTRLASLNDYAEREETLFFALVKLDKRTRRLLESLMFGRLVLQ